MTLQRYKWNYHDYRELSNIIHFAVEHYDEALRYAATTWPAVDLQTIYGTAAQCDPLHYRRMHILIQIFYYALASGQEYGFSKHRGLACMGIDRMIALTACT